MSIDGDESKESPGTYNYIIESVDNAAKILLMLTTKPSIRSIDIAKEIGVARSTAHRMVSTLQHRGLLRQNPDDKSFSAGYGLVELGMSVIGATDFKAEVEPYLARLAAECGETAQLLVLEDQEVVFVAGVEGSHVIRASSRVGTRLPAHTTAGGRCLLSALSLDSLHSIYPKDRLSGGTSDAIHTRKALEADLVQVRQDGYAINESASEEGLLAVSRLVLDAKGVPQGAISISGPVDRLEANMADIHARLLSTVSQIENRILNRSAG